MELTKNFEPQSVDDKWYSHWMSKGYFKSVPDDREPYTIVMPPPNVTGVLHMGHCLNNTIQDILIRRARMQGKNACWVPGTDHASIATEAKVVAMLREKGITKSSLSREEFLKYAWEWKEKYGGIILEQLKKMGCSLDWGRTTFTMDADYYKSVIETFVHLHKAGIIYRGLRMVNWDPASKTALSDEEVIFKDVDSKFYHVHYPFADATNGGITVATTRPETILGDVAICVNPEDERYKNIIGKEVTVPIINRKIKIIADEYVTADFGTGALKVTPAHDKNDHEIGKKHNLKVLNTLDAEGKFTAEDLMTENPSEQILAYVGLDRFVLRKKIAEDIEAIGLLEKVEQYKGQVGTSERTGAVIESRLSLQWFMDMKKFLAKNPEVISAVMNDEINFHPVKFKNLYNHWMTNIKDWCISRQLWWGQRIPAWYGPNRQPVNEKFTAARTNEGGEWSNWSWQNGEELVVVAQTRDEAIEIFVSKYISQGNEESKARKFAQDKIIQDEDCLDTWFSSWLWPFEVFKGMSNKNNEEVNYYYPTSTLVTAPEIIFFWVARMIMAGKEFMNNIPFKDVYFTGIVRDKQGRKMSKSLGNSPDLLALIDQYGADAARFGIMIASPAGNDILFDESALEQGRNFNNKMWNALKLVRMWKERTTDDGQQLSVVDGQSSVNGGLSSVVDSRWSLLWFENRLAQVKIEVNALLNDYKLSEALKVIYSLIWDDFCSWYLEWVKPGFEQPIEKVVYEKTVIFFSELMELLHPFMPFVTEEIYHLLEDKHDDLCNKVSPFTAKADVEILAQGSLLKNIISGIRDVRNKNQIKPKETIKIHIQTNDLNIYKSIESILAKQVNSQAINYVSETVANTITTVIGKDTFYIETEQPLNRASQKADLEKELTHLQGFLITVEKKLGNEKFVANAKPEVLALEQKKKADALEKISVINVSLQNMN
jgi:valyl-tRNA synthetase